MIQSHHTNNIYSMQHAQFQDPVSLLPQILYLSLRTEPLSSIHANPLSTAPFANPMSIITLMFLEDPLQQKQASSKDEDDRRYNKQSTRLLVMRSEVITYVPQSSVLQGESC